jgi:hypothetical protein
VAGVRVAKEGIRGIIDPGNRKDSNLTESMARYRLFVFGEGMTEGVQGPDGPAIRAGISPEKVRQVFAQKGKLGWGDYVRCRVRYFTDGAVIGSRGWVNQVFEDHRQRFGSKRKDGARRFKFLEESDIFGLRDLRLEPVGVSGGQDSSE